ncbi:hypothetical protein AKJ40_01670 [candidate division MSBL1 archaeon SCGC-AAA259M10]|uniref:Uncharacterized protein n=1 Tax=candidate division MSBL1 archaeon SCGC-AAA259M10 TaxID=1698270 RepID=A0A133V1A0_9EURY|nr:hypothetical protein AKJ40_01670 [candidate division MSBL1 archaeon SCGC-AAA259M10]
MDEEFTEQDVADELGISGGWVNNAKQELINSNILSNENIRTRKQKRKEIKQELIDSNIGNIANIRTRAKKREQVKEALEENPEKSNVEIAKELDVSDPFVGKVRKGTPPVVFLKIFDLKYLRLLMIRLGLF